MRPRTVIIYDNGTPYSTTIIYPGHMSLRKARDALRGLAGYNGGVAYMKLDGGEFTDRSAMCRIAATPNKWQDVVLMSAKGKLGTYRLIRRSTRKQEQKYYYLVCKPLCPNGQIFHELQSAINQFIKNTRKII